MLNRALSLSTALVAMLIVAATPLPAFAGWSSFGGITQILVEPDGQYLRIRVNDLGGAAASGAAGCASSVFIDVLLGEGDTEELKLMYSAIQMAFLTYRDIRFKVREDTCSTIDASTTIPVATAVHLKN